MKKKSVNSSLLDNHCDLRNNGILRVFRHQVAAKCMPMGNYGGGAGFKCICVFIALHYFGGFVFPFLIRYERQAAAMYRVLAKLKNRGK